MHLDKSINNNTKDSNLISDKLECPISSQQSSLIHALCIACACACSMCQFCQSVCKNVCAHMHVCAEFVIAHVKECHFLYRSSFPHRELAPCSTHSIPVASTVQHLEWLYACDWTCCVRRKREHAFNQSCIADRNYNANFSIYYMYSFSAAYPNLIRFS